MMTCTYFEDWMGGTDWKFPHLVLHNSVDNHFIRDGSPFFFFFLNYCLQIRGCLQIQKCPNFPKSRHYPFLDAWGKRDSQNYNIFLVYSGNWIDKHIVSGCFLAQRPLWKDTFLPFFLGPLQITASLGLLSKNPTDITPRLSSTYWIEQNQPVNSLTSMIWLLILLSS